MSLEQWKSIFDWGTIVFVALTVFTGAAALINGSKLAKHQDEQLRQFDKDLTDGKSALAKQQERAANAEARLAELERETATARAEMSTQQVRAANAERNLLELKERIKPRKLSEKQSADFIAILKTVPVSTRLKFATTAGGGDEAFNLLKQLMSLFKEAGWSTAQNTIDNSYYMELQVTGIALLLPEPEGVDPRKPLPTEMIRLTPMQASLQAAFRSVGMELQFLRWYHSPDGVPELVVGSKP